MSATAAQCIFYLCREPCTGSGSETCGGQFDRGRFYELQFYKQFIESIPSNGAPKFEIGAKEKIEPLASFVSFSRSLMLSDTSC